MKNQQQILNEMKLRRLIRKAIKIKKDKNRKEESKSLIEEGKLRKIIRTLLKEGDVDSDTKPAPYESTALSALADAFDQILPILKTGLRKLRKGEERQSYRAHVLQKFDSMFSNFEGLDAKQAIGESDLNEEELTVKLDDRPDDAMVVPDSEKDRFKPKEEPELEADDADIQSLAISTEDPTGARFAFSTINNSNIEKLLGDKRKLLPTDDYREEFKQYALYNVDLWLLTYEKELADELGSEPAFDTTVTERPEGAQVQATAQEFESGAGEEVGGEVSMELPDETVEEIPPPV
jgi:hypothetical protein